MSCEPAPPSGTLGHVDRAGPWSGALWLQWPWCHGVWRLRLPYRAVVALLGEEAPGPATRPTVRDAALLPLGQALGEQRLAVRVELQPVDLSLGQLQDLRLGDVVALDHALDQPLRVVTADGVPVCGAWLGQREGRIAVELDGRPAARPSVPTNPVFT